MQRRLSELGYPVGTVDGVFGEDTLLALNLFQFVNGYQERSYANEKCLNMLYSAYAPIYDPYLPLYVGDKGTPVTIMQTRLLVLGYDPGTIDGVYGTKTIAALAAFQQVAGLPVDGTAATAETLLLLYDDENAPVAPTVTPATNTDL